MRSSMIAALLLLGAVVASAEYKPVALGYALKDMAPAIDATTMNYHFNTHYKTYLKNLNEAIASVQSAPKNDLTALIQAVPKLSPSVATTVRNQGGGAWNHALYFKHLAPPGSQDTSPAAMSKELSAAITTSFGSVAAMQSELKAAATKVFGSGWAWLCYTGDKLVVTSTPNQDNPLMGSLPNAPAVKSSGCAPILGLDVWEHAYYLKHGPKRAAYLDDFFKVVNWKQVSSNFEAAKKGRLSALVA